MREFVMGGHEEGPMIVRVPEKITVEEYDDLERWFGLILRQAKRRVLADIAKATPINTHLAEAP